MTKRIWAWIGLVAASLLVLSGCGRQKAEDTLTVGLSQVGAESAWRTANSESPPRLAVTSLIPYKNGQPPDHPTSPAAPASPARPLSA